MKKAFFFSMDAFLAATLLMATLLLITQHTDLGTPQQETIQLSQDALQALSAIKMKEIQDPGVQTSIASGIIDDPESSVVLQLGKFWAQNLTTEARTLSDIVLDKVLPPNFHVTVLLEDELLYNTTGADPVQVASARRMISGVAKGEALTGSTGTAFLQSVAGKENKKFAFFGGFVGQGDITVLLEDLPSDIGPATIIEATLEGEFDDEFTLWINGAQCGGTYPASSDLEILSYDVSSCNSSFTAGDNDIELRFSTLENGSISGGFLRVTYITSEFNAVTERTTQYLPGIEGIINLYDGLSTPGTLQNLSLYLHFEISEEPRPLFFDIGNVTVYETNETGEFEVNLTDAYLKTKLDYSLFHESTVPYRFGYFDGNTTNTSGNITDVFLLTSRHNSMGTNDIFVSPGVNRTRMEQAKIADNLFVDIVLNATGNRVGLISFGTGASVDTDSDLTTDAVSLTTTINGYAEHPSDAQRNLCGSLEEAKTLLLAEGGARSRAIMFMTDGDLLKPTGNTPRCDGSPTNNLALVWEDTVKQACDFADPVHGNPQNITFYAVAFGPEATNNPAIIGNLSLMANCTGGKFASGSNSTALEEIYETFGEEIGASSIAYTFQRITGSEGVASNLYSDSHFEMNYTSSLSEPGPTQIAVTFQTEQFNSCTPIVEFQPQVEVYEAVLNSYSGDFWTKSLSIDGTTLYNLSDYKEDYSTLGDPARILVPASSLGPGSHTFDITLGANATEDEECSFNNSLIYGAYINTTVSRGSVLPTAEGCTWSVEFEDGGNITVTIPPEYTGPDICAYNSTDIIYDPLDTYDEVVFRLLDNLDFDDDGRIFVNLDAADLEVVVTVVSDVPYLWGPSMARVVVSR